MLILGAEHTQLEEGAFVDQGRLQPHLQHDDSIMHFELSSRAHRARHPDRRPKPDMQADLEKLPDILLAVPEAMLQDLQKNLGHVWHRFLYTSLGVYERETRDALNRHLSLIHPATPASLPAPLLELKTQDDAFHTIMAILYDKMLDV